MYAQFQIYPVFYCTQALPAYQEFDSHQVLRELSRAVGMKFQEFYAGKHQQTDIPIQNVCESQSLQNRPQDQMIELISNGQEKEEAFNYQKKKSKNAAFNEQTTPSSKLESSKQSLLSEKIVCQQSISSCQQNLFHHKKTIQIRDQSHVRLDSFKMGLPVGQYINFEAQIPERQMESCEILRRKEALLRRKVSDWNQIPAKGKKQRRQIRMLKK